MIKESIVEGLEALDSGANDVIVAKQSDGSFLSTPIVVQVGKTHNWETFFKSREDKEMKIYINGKVVKTEAKLLIEENGKACFDRQNNQINMKSDEWKTVDLKPGLNRGQFIVFALDAKIDFSVFL